MLWIILSLATAMAVAGRDFSVKVFSGKLTAMEIAVLELFWSLPFFITALMFIPIPELDPVFWQAFLISFPLNWSSYLLYIAAITLAPLTLTVPLLSFTPVFMIITGSLVLAEEINVIGVAGIMLIVIGSYLLHLDKIKDGVLAPVKAILTDRGPRLMFAVAFIFAIAAVYGKQGMQHSSPLFFTFFFFLTCNITMLIGFAAFKRLSFALLWKQRKKGLWLGVLFTSHILCHCLAIIQAKAAYMIAIKRSSILFSLLLGWLILKESQIANRGVAALLMFGGAALITLYG